MDSFREGVLSELIRKFRYQEMQGAGLAPALFSAMDPYAPLGGGSVS